MHATAGGLTLGCCLQGWKPIKNGPTLLRPSPSFPSSQTRTAFLHFPVPVPGLGGGQDLFVRKVYEALCDHVTDSSLKGFVVSGNVGFGKSWWLVWALIK